MSFPIARGNRFAYDAAMKSAWLVFALIAATAVAQDAASIAADRTLWPKTVVVSIPLDAPVIIAGKESGSIKLPAGREYPVKAVTAESVTVDLGGTTRVVPAGDTDLLLKSAAVRAANEAGQERARALAAMPTPTPKPAAPTPAPAPKIENVIGAKLSNLVFLDGKKLSPFDAAPLANKKFLAVYYSAAWCGPCRNFTPDLVKWYNRNKSKAELFELVFVSADRSADQMAQYMVDDKMPWPAMDFASIKAGSPIVGKGGPGIPSLVVFDATGKPVAESYVNGEYVGPRQVLQDFDKLLKKSD